MSSSRFYTQFNQVASKLQVLASELTGDMETARALYLETVYRAKMNVGHFQQDQGFKDWITDLMKSIFLNSNRG